MTLSLLMAVMGDTIRDRPIYHIVSSNAWEAKCDIRLMVYIARLMLDGCVDELSEY